MIAMCAWLLASAQSWRQQFRINFENEIRAA